MVLKEYPLTKTVVDLDPKIDSEKYVSSKTGISSKRWNISKKCTSFKKKI